MNILVVDDEASIRDAYQQILEKPSNKSQARLLARELFEDLNEEEEGTPTDIAYAVTYAKQGLEAVSLVENANAARNPFKVAFIDIRMPPGIDGKETARRIRAIDPDVNIVIVTGYSDHSVTDIAAVAGPPHKIFYIQKPFAAAEVRQMAQALVERWDHDTRQLEQLREKMVELAASEARAHHMANHDLLTGLPNRLSFHRELVEQLLSGREGLYLAFLGMRRLNSVNERCGHEAGDDLLCALAKDLRVAAPARSILARVSSEQFAILYRSASVSEAAAIADTLLQQSSAVRNIFGQSMQIDANCGLVNCGEFAGAESHDLMRYAELALVEAVEKDIGEACIFKKDMDNAKRFKQKIENGLVNALKYNELNLQYQAIIESNTQECIGFEALLRWTSQEYGPVSPAVFIPIAEECGLIGKIGNWVIDHAIADARSWPEKVTSINVSPKQFKDTSWIQRLSDRCEEYGIRRDSVQIELTETAFFENQKEASECIAHLRKMGFLVALDDFGTGYSSMCNLRDFEIDCVKIDRGFVNSMGKDGPSSSIIHALGQLANNLGLKTIAEGVECEDQYKALCGYKFSHMQGYLFGKPMPAADCSRAERR